MMTSTRLIASAAVAALFAAPGFAQSDQNQGRQTEMQASDSGQTTQQSGQKKAQGQSGRSVDAAESSPGDMTEEERRAMVASQEKVRETLSGAGFTDIRVQSASYLVAAMSPQGEPVMMLIDTDRRIRDAYRAQDQQQQQQMQEQGRQTQ